MIVFIWCSIGVCVKVNLSSRLPTIFLFKMKTSLSLKKITMVWDPFETQAILVNECIAYFMSLNWFHSNFPRIQRLIFKIRVRFMLLCYLAFWNKESHTIHEFLNHVTYSIQKFLYRSQIYLLSKHQKNKNRIQQIDKTDKITSTAMWAKLTLAVVVVNVAQASNK